MEAEVFLYEPPRPLDWVHLCAARVVRRFSQPFVPHCPVYEVMQFFARTLAAGKCSNDLIVARREQLPFSLKVVGAARIGNEPLLKWDGHHPHTHRSPWFARFEEIEGAILGCAVQEDHAIRAPPSGPKFLKLPGYRTRVFSYGELPPLRDPIMVVGLTGWVDAGNTSAQLSELLTTRLGAAPFAEIDLSDRLDFSHTRPMLSGLGDDRHVSFPRLTCSVSDDDATPNASVLLLSGPELSLEWPSVTEGIVDFAQQLGVQRMVSFTGMPAVVTHRRKLPVVAAEFGKRRLAPAAESVTSVQVDYQGPTGLNAVILEAASRAGIPAVGVWTQVPIYLASAMSVLGVEALLPVVNTLCEVELDPNPIATRAEFERATIDEKARTDEDLQVAIRAADDIDDLGASELIWEIESFLEDPNDPTKDTE